MLLRDSYLIGSISIFCIIIYTAINYPQSITFFICSTLISLIIGILIGKYLWRNISKDIVNNLYTMKSKKGFFLSLFGVGLIIAILIGYVRARDIMMDDYIRKIFPGLSYCMFCITFFISCYVLFRIYRYEKKNEKIYMDIE